MRNMKGKIGGAESILIGVVATLAVVVVVFLLAQNAGMFAVTQPAQPGGPTQPVVPGYTPFGLTHVYLYLYDAMDTKTAFGGADDAQCKAWDSGKFDFLGPYIDTDSQSSTGQVDFSAAREKTGTKYDVLCYENDGGTPVYANKFDMSVPQVAPATVTTWTFDSNVNMYKEGAFAESACDSATAAFDEGGDTVTLNKTLSTVQGVLEWDCTVGQSTAGAVLKNPVIIFREDPATPMTDINDIEAIYVSVKTGSGVTLPGGNLVDKFKAGAPVAITSTGMLTSADSAVVTVKVQLPSAEANVGTGNFQMIYDDLSDYRAKDLDYDVRAAAEVTTFVITV